MRDDHAAPTPNTRKSFDEYRNSFWFWVLDRYGLPILLIVAIGWAGVRFTEWLRPKADQLFEKHIEIVDTAKALGQESLEVQRDVKDLMDKVVNDGSQMDKTTQEHLRITTEIRADVKDLHRTLVEPPRPTPRATEVSP